MNLYVVLKWVNEKQRFEHEGVFDSISQAESICIDGSYGVFPCKLNQHLPDYNGWPGSWYPKSPWDSNTPTR